MAIIANLDIVIGAQTTKGKAAINSLGGAITGLRNQLVGIGAAVGTFLGARAAINTALNFSNEVGELADFGRSVGETYNNLRALQFQAEQSGTSFEALATAIQRTETAFSRAVGGATAQVEAFRDLGLSIAELRQQSPVERFFAIADALNSLPDPAERAALAAELFGRSWAEIGVVLAEGSPAFAAARQRIKELGLEIEDSTAQQIKAFGDRTNELGAALAGLATGGLANLVLVLDGLTQGLISAAAVVKSFGESIGRGGVKVVALVGSFAAMVAVAPRVIGAFRSIVTALKSLIAAAIGAQAATGPKGILKAAASAAAVAAATVTSLAVVEAAFSEIDNAAAEAEASTKASADAMAGAGDAMANEAKEAEALALAQLKAADAAAALAESMQQRGQQLAASLRTPIEQFRAGLQELQGLAAAGVIDTETARRAIKKQLGELKNNLAATPITLNLGSADRNSTEAATTLLSRKLDSAASLQRDLLQATNEGNDTLDAIEQTLRDMARNSGSAVDVGFVGL